MSRTPTTFVVFMAPPSAAESELGSRGRLCPPATPDPQLNMRPGLHWIPGACFQALPPGIRVVRPVAVELAGVLLHESLVLFLGLVPRVPVALLEQAEQLLGLALDPVEVIVRELAPLLLDLPLHLPPLSLHDVLVHQVLLAHAVENSTSSRTTCHGNQQSDYASDVPKIGTTPVGKKLLAPCGVPRSLLN